MPVNTNSFPFNMVGGVYFSSAMKHNFVLFYVHTVWLLLLLLFALHYFVVLSFIHSFFMVYIQEVLTPIFTVLHFCSACCLHLCFYFCRPRPQQGAESLQGGGGVTGGTGGGRVRGGQSEEERRGEGRKAEETDK